MPRKRYKINPDDKVVAGFVEGLLKNKRDWREFLTAAGYSEYQIDEFMRHIDDNGLKEICTMRRGEMLVSPHDLQEWLDAQKTA